MATRIKYIYPETNPWYFSPKRMAELEKNGKFDCYRDQATVGTRWTRWLQSFELFVDSQGILIAEGSDKINNDDGHNSFITLVPTCKIYFIHSKTLAKLMTMPPLLINAFNAYFAPKVNSAYARHTFCQLQQNSSETILQFASCHWSDYKFVGSP